MKEKVLYWYYSLWMKWFDYTQWYRALRAKWYARLPKQLSAQQVADAKCRGNEIDAYDREKAKIQSKCTHKKGGWVPMQGSSDEIRQALSKGGNGSQYAVFKHQHIPGDIWVECLRCGKKWKPPIRTEYETEREFYRAVEEYEKAISFETNNHTSTSVLCQFRLNRSLDAGTEYVRKQLATS
jgi:hypothetical protein